MKSLSHAFPARPQAVFKMPSERYFYFSDGLFLFFVVQYGGKFFGQSADALRGVVESGQMALDGGNQCLVVQAEQGGIAAETARTDFGRAEADLQLVAVHGLCPILDGGTGHDQAAAADVEFAVSMFRQPADARFVNHA